MPIELNPFEIKAEITKIFKELDGVKDFENYEIHYRNLDMQSDKTVICKLLFREINNSNQELTKFLLVRYCPKKDLIEKLWEIIKNNLYTNQAKIFALDLLRDLDTNWSYEECEKYIDNPDELVSSDTKKILDSAIVNPEVQIDFLDFISTLPEQDRIILLDSLADDYSKDELANMLIPVFLSMSNTETGKKALDILGNSKSQLAYHALNASLDFVDKSLVSVVKRNLTTLKLAGIREDNTIEFYKKLLQDSKPYKFCITYPDGHGNQAVIFSRENKSGKIQFVAVVIDDYRGIRDCFGFNEISKFECNAIIERFYRGQRAVDLTPKELKFILKQAEKLAKTTLPYEYVCWRNLLADIENTDYQLEYEIKKLSKNEFENILKYDFTDYWFLDSQYSDEFEEFLRLADKTEVKDFDKIIDENVDLVFDSSESKIWTQRILNTAILKHFAGNNNEAENLYSVYNDETLIKELFKNILRKSLYEYYFAKKDEQKVKEIENMWVK